MTEAEEMSGNLPGSRVFMGSLQDTTTKLWKNISDEERLVYVKLAKKWSDEPPPPHIQNGQFCQRKNCLRLSEAAI
ncbi:hypothetical protein V8E53_006128 [Lactarius tabidus]